MKMSLVNTNNNYNNLRISLVMKLIPYLAPILDEPLPAETPTPKETNQAQSLA